jgi:hypothetical protein
MDLTGVEIHIQALEFRREEIDQEIRLYRGLREHLLREKAREMDRQVALAARDRPEADQDSDREAGR